MNKPENRQNINTVDKPLNKGQQPNEQRKSDSPRKATVTPDNDNGKPGAPTDEHMSSSNKDGGPAGENL